MTQNRRKWQLKTMPESNLFLMRYYQWFETKNQMKWIWVNLKEIVHLNSKMKNERIKLIIKEIEKHHPKILKHN